MITNRRPTAATRHSATRPSTHRVFAALAVGALAITACGGDGDGDSFSGGAEPDVIAEAPDDVPTDELDGLDEGQIDILDDVTEGLEDEFGDENDGEAAAPWSGVRLIDARGSVREEALDADAFSGVTEGFTTPIDNPLGNIEYNSRTLDNSVVVDDSVWVSAETSLTRVSLADGTITATIPIDDVVAGGEFGDITGDSNGVYAIAAMRGGGSFVADVDPTAGTLRGTIDLTADVTSLLTIASNDTHVAAAYDSAPGIPVQLIDRATGTITEIGDYLKLHEVQFVRDELWIVIGSGKVSEPATYEKYSLDGTLIGEGTLPRPGTLRVFADRAVLVEPSNAADPSAPVAPVEVEPVGTPIEALLPDGTVLLTAYAEIDGYAISSSACCLKDDADFPLNTAVVDMATGDVVHTADSVQATAILPALAA